MINIFGLRFRIFFISYICMYAFIITSDVSAESPVRIKKNPVCGDGQCSANEIKTCPADCVDVIGPVDQIDKTVIHPLRWCGDGVCNGNETVKTCCVDCRPNSHMLCADQSDHSGDGGDVNPMYCGDGVCNANETMVSCLKDCHCGDGQCNYGENNSSCGTDCYCGDGMCMEGEDYEHCAQDCPRCGDFICNPALETLLTCPSDCSCPVTDPSCNLSQNRHSLDFFAFDNNRDVFEPVPYPAEEDEIGNMKTLVKLTINDREEGADPYVYVGPETNCSDLVLDLNVNSNNYFDKYRVWMGFDYAKNLLIENGGTMRCFQFQFEDIKALDRDLFPGGPAIRFGAELDEEGNVRYQNGNPIPDSTLQEYQTGAAVHVPVNYNPNMLNRLYFNLEQDSVATYLARFIIKRAESQMPATKFVYLDNLFNHYKPSTYLPGTTDAQRIARYAERIDEILAYVKTYDPQIKLMLNGPYVQPVGNPIDEILNNTYFAPYLVTRRHFDISMYEDFIQVCSEQVGGACKLRNPLEFFDQIASLKAMGIRPYFSTNDLPAMTPFGLDAYNTFLWAQLMAAGTCDEDRGGFFMTEVLLQPAPLTDYWFYYRQPLGDAVEAMPSIDSATGIWSRHFTSGKTIKFNAVQNRIWLE